jgi:hypothetical protein
MCAGGAQASLSCMSAASPAAYRIVVRGRLSERFQSAFCGMTLHSQDGATALVGTLADQSHLFGLLEHIHSLGLELIRVEPVDE